MSKEITVSLVQYGDSFKQDSLWYDGLIATLTDGENTVEMWATGDVSACLYDTNGEIVEEFRRGNGTVFATIMDYYIGSDKKLYDMLDSEQLVLDDNNWFEYSVKNADGEYVLDDTLDGSYYECLGFIISHFAEMTEGI